MKSFFFSSIIFMVSTVQFDLSATETTNDSNANFTIPKTSESISIDADLSDAAWKSAHKIHINNVTWPSENTPSPVKTEAFIIEDGEVLYVAFKAYDDQPENIRANLTDRDSNWNDDKVAIKIDTYGDSVLAYQFFINPLGTQSDVIENELTKKESASWDVIWDSAGKITDYGYVVEVAIPLRNLNFNDSLDIQQWKMEFVRFYPRRKELRISNLKMDQNNSCWICQMGNVSGLKGAKQGNNFTAVPTFVSGHSESRDLDETRQWDSESNNDVGLDLKWGITPDITLNATINPDFSQVEADSGQLNVNSTFALFTPERRSFFLANQDYFASPVNLIYTRNINEPDYGAKVAGKLGAHSFGAFAANDTSTSFLLPGNLGSNIHELEEESTNAVLRYRYAVDNNTSLGTTTTIRESDSYHNYLTSFDGKYKPTDNDTFDIQIMRSDTSMTEELIESIKEDASDEQSLRADMVNSTDVAYQLRYKHENRDWFVNARHENTGANFRADLAFFNNSDKIKNVIGGGRIWRGEESDWLHRIQLSGDWDQTTNQEGEQIEQEFEMWLNLSGPDQFFTRNGFVIRDRAAGRIDESVLTIKNNIYEFTEKQFRSWTEFKPVSNFWFGALVSFGEGIDYANKQLGETFNFRPNIRWNINTHLSAMMAYKYGELNEINGNNILTTKLTDFRMTYQFSIRSFLRLSIVYSDVERNLENYNEDIRGDYDAHERNLSTQLLFSYKVNPQTLFFIGYSDGAEQNDSLDSLTKNNRSAFMKLSYAWLL